MDYRVICNCGDYFNKDLINWQTNSDDVIPQGMIGGSRVDINR